MACAFFGGDANGIVGAVCLFLSLRLGGEEGKVNGGAIGGSVCSDNRACCFWIALMRAWPRGHVDAAMQ